MVFKTIASDITTSGQALSFFGKELRSIYRDFNSAVNGIKTGTGGISQFSIGRIFGNKLSQQDIQAIRNYNVEIQKYNNFTEDAVTPQTAFYRCLGNSSSAAQQLARDANGAAVSEEALTAATNRLTFAQKVSAITSKAMGVALKMALNVGAVLLINGIITLVSDFVNEQKELREAARDSAQEIENQTKSLKDLKEAYLAIVDSDKTTIEKTEELNTWKQELIETYGFEKEALEELNTEREKGIGLLDEEIEKQNRASRGEWLGNNASAIKTARNKIENNQNGLTGGQTDGIIRIEDVSVDGKINLDNIDNKIIDMFKSAEHKSDDGLLFQYTEFEAAGDDMIEKYENLQEIISALGNDIDRTDEEERLLELLNNEAAAMKKVLDENRSIYETYYEFTAQNNYEDYAKDNPVEDVGKSNYLSWKQGLLKTAEGDIQLEKELGNIVADKFSELDKYFENLNTSYKMFGIDDIINDANEGMKKAFLNGLSDEDLEIATQIPDLFAEGLDGASKKIEEFKTNNPISPISPEVDTSPLEELQEAYDDLSKSVSTFTKNQDTVSSAFEEQEKHGQLSADTIQSLVEAGYAEALMYDETTGKVTLNKDAYEKLNAEKKEKIRLDLESQKSKLKDRLNEEETAVSDLRQEYEALAKSDMQSNAGRLSDIALELAKRGANIEDIRGLISQINGDITSLTAPSFENDNTDKNKEAFDKLYSQWNHDLEMNRVTQDEYINWLDGAYKHYFSDLTKYQDEYNKYEEEVYKARSDREQKLFDKKIDNLEKLADKALDDKIEIPDVNKELEEFNKKMQSEYGLGNVDLTKRPKVAMDDGSTATVLSSSEFLWQGDEENGEYVAVHYTPILPDGTILDDNTLAKYLYETLEGSDDILKADTKGLVLKVDTGLNITDADFNSLETDNPTQHIQDVIKACDNWDVALHEIQEQWLSVSEAAENATTTATNKFDYAREQINKAIAEIQARIDGIRNGTISGNTDDIETLIDDLDSLNDKLIDINKKEIESEKDYISELKDDYSDIMDERIDKVDELSDKIEKSYDKQIDALEKIKDTEDRIKKIKDAQLEVEEKEKALDEAKREDAKNNYVYFDGAGMSVQTSTENQQKAQQELEESRKDLEEAYREEEINVLKEQKEAATTYYDNVKDNLEKQKTQGEKTYEAVEKIYEKLSGDKKQTSSNAELVEKLSKSGDISKAMSELSDTERQKVIDTGVVKVQPNGDYTFDYSAFEKYSSTVDDNTLATQDLTSVLKDIVTQADTNNKNKTDNSMVAGGFNLVADPKTGKLTKKQVMVNGEVVEGLGHKVYATSKEEWQEHNNSEKTSKGSFAGYNTFIDFMRAVSAGKVDISPLTNAFNSGYNPFVDKMNKSVSDTINNVSNSNVNNINNKPVVNLTVNVEGSADKKTVEAFRNVAATEITNAFNQLNRKLDNTKI